MRISAADQAKSAYEQAVNGYTAEERQIAVANVQKAASDIAAVQSIIDQMVITAPLAAQVYKRNVEPGEYISPGVPLVTLIDLNDLWIHFDLREDRATGDFDLRTFSIRAYPVEQVPELRPGMSAYMDWQQHP
jgi:HlyD family secretion protein